MPSLQEILVDPNYTGANPATKKAIFDKYAAQDTNYTQANDATRDAIRQRFGLVQAPPPQEQPVTAKPKLERTWGEAIKDVGAGVVSGAGSLVELPSQIYGLVTGDMGKPAETNVDKARQIAGMAIAGGPVGQAILEGQKSVGKKMQEYGEEMKSPALKQMEQARAEKIAAAEEEGQLSAFGTAFGETIKNPALLLNFLAEQAPQLLVPFGAGKAGAAISLARSAGKGLVAEEAVKLAGKTAVKSAVGAGAVQQGADVGAGAYENIYKELKSKGASDEEAAEGALNLARATGASAAIISLLAQKLPGAQTIEKALVGVPKEAGKVAARGLTGRVVGGVKGALGEGASEIAEEVGGKFSQNLAMREVKPEQSLVEGLGQTAGMAAVGGVGMGGVTGLAQRPAAIEKEPTVIKPPVDEINTPIAPPIINNPPPPTAKVDITQANLGALKDYTQGLPENAADIFARMQNRDRATPASIQQVQGIASNPDYDRLKTSPDFGSGAPVVISDMRIPDNQLGRVDVVTASDGRKIPVQYAVINADQLLASHTADGRTNPDYGNVSTPAIRAVAGNGRIAGLQAAYGSDTASDYRSAMSNDNQHGIEQGQILDMSQPVLVRIMPKSLITSDIGDVSNVAGQLRLNPVEAAKNDLNRFDLSGLQYGEDGSVNTQSLIQFVKGMPKEEQGELLDSNGVPNTKAIDRLNNAIFYKAYGSDSLINLYAQAADPEAKLILQALARSASNVSKLEGAGEYDIRPNIVEAAELVVTAKRSGIKLKDFVTQGQIGLDPNTLAILEMFAENSRSGKRMGELIGNLADAAYDQSQAGEDMFGQKPKAPLDEIFKILKKPPEGGEDLFTPPETKAPVRSYKINKSPEQIAKELDGKGMNEVAQWLIDNAPNPIAKVIAEHVHKRIEQFVKSGVATEFRILKGSNRNINALGTEVITTEGSPKNRTVIDPKIPARILVRINGPVENGDASSRAEAAKTGAKYAPVGVNYRTLLHELVHASTDVQIGYLGRRLEKKGVALKNSGKLYEDLKSLRKKVITQLNKDISGLDNKYNYADFKKRMLENEDEFIAYGLTEKEFQDYLASIKFGKQTVYGKLVDIVRQVLGLNHNYQSALEELMRITEEGFGIEGKELVKDVKQKYPSSIIFGKATKESTKDKPEQLESKEKNAKIPTKDDIIQETQDFLQKRKPLQPESFDGVSPEFMGKANPVFAPQKKTILDRINGLRDGFWRKTAQGLADQFRTIKDYSEIAYIKARLSKSIDGALEGLMMYGEVFNDGGALNIKPNTKGLLEILKPLGVEVDRFNMWKALTRESQLPANKRSKFIDKNGKDIMPELVAKRDELIKGDLNGKSRKELYESVRKDMQKLNESVLKVALEMGLIDSTANMIKRIQEQIDYIENKEGLSNGAKNRQIEELQQKIDELRKDPIGYERFANDINYIPFYREMEDGDIDAVMTASSLTNQHFSKALEGGNSPFADLMENTLRNWSHILSASMKAQAAKATIDAAILMGGAEPNLKQQFVMIDDKVNVVVRKKDADGNIYEDAEVYKDGRIEPWMTTAGKNSIKIMIDGSPAYFNVLDPMLLDSISSIGYMGPKSKFLDVARGFKNMLQYGVTISPAFKVRNLIRDSISAMAVSDLKKNPFANIVNGWAESNKNNPAYISALVGGAVFNFGSTYEGDQAKMIKRLVAQGVKPEHILDSPAKVKEGLKMAWDKYQEWGNKSESANRMALYTQMRDKGMSHLEASFNARDLLDFSMSGSWPAFRQVAQVVPFLNARVQGLYKLGRDGIIPTARVAYNSITGKEIWNDEAHKLSDQQKAASFSIVTSAVCLASLALYFAFKDDDEFKKRDEWDRDNFWWFKLPGMDYALRVPKPFEIGAFGTLAERIAEQISDEGAEGKQFEDSLKRMVTDTFAVNLPQFVKPLVDLYANKDSFTGAPIESAGLERLSKQERTTDTTSPLAMALGGLSSIMPFTGEGMSPVQMDYAIKAYFGWLGSAVAESSHYAVMPFKEGAYPDSKWVDRASVGLVKSLPSNQSKFATAFYESNKEISQAMADMRHYASIGDIEKVIKIMEEKGDKIALAKIYDRTAKRMAAVRNQIKLIQNDTVMDGATKREEIDRLKELIGMMAEQAEETRKSMK
jgi:hypothetical protein